MDVIATGKRNRPVNDLKEGDFQVFEKGERKRKTPRRISAFHTIDPTLGESSAEEPSSGFRVTAGEGCAIGRQTHYQVAYQPSPDGWIGGYHEILLATSRPGVKLFYRRRYYVGETRELAKLQLPGDARRMPPCSRRPASIRRRRLRFRCRPGWFREQAPLRCASSCRSRLAGVYRALGRDEAGPARLGICTFDGEEFRSTSCTHL